MYPQRYYELFPAFPVTLDVFVAMSFNDNFNARYANVVKPGIEAVRIGAQPLRSVRVDARVISDSILTDILNGIGKSRIIFVDVTSEGMFDGKAIRNGNVMYELGIAHSTIIPEEVVVFRSDDAPLLFDTANIRVNKYDPDADPETARTTVAKTILRAIREIDLTRANAIAKAASSLDVISWGVLNLACRPPGIKHRSSKTIGEALGNTEHNTAILRLLDMGAIEADFKIFTKDNVSELSGKTIQDLVLYRATQFGIALSRFIANRMRLIAPEVRSEINIQSATEAQLKKKNSST
jgi:hypothetical protein